MYILNDLEQKQLRDKIKRARSKRVPNPFQISELELDIRVCQKRNFGSHPLIPLILKLCRLERS